MITENSYGNCKHYNIVPYFLTLHSTYPIGWLTSCHFPKSKVMFAGELLIWRLGPIGPCGARSRCRISPPRFLAECHKRRLNQGSFVSAVCLVVCFLWFVLCLCVYFVIYIKFFPYCLFISNIQVIGCEHRFRNDLYCVGWGVKLYSIQSNRLGPMSSGWC